MKLVAKPTTSISTTGSAAGHAGRSDVQPRQWDTAGPQYTAYPTADRFVEAFGPAQYRQALRRRAQGAVVGMDQFALPADALAVAKRQGRLHRGARGYTTQPDCDLIGLGVSAFSRVGATCSQNARSLPEYRDALARGDFAVMRGLALSRDDLLRRTVIMALMCQGRVEFQSVELAHLVRVHDVFVTELAQLREFEAAGLVQVTEQEVQVTEKGWLQVNLIAMVFDRYLQSDKAREREGVPGI